jgi:ribonucleoside-diphosphate reductase alpha chain
MLHEQLDGQLRLVQLDPLQGQDFLVLKRDGRVVPFEETRILLAIEAAFKADAGLHRDQELPHAAQCNVKGETLEIERLQDLAETQLMEAGHHGAARRFILYREERRKARALRGDRTIEGELQAHVHVTLPDGLREPLDPQRIRRRLIGACRGVEKTCSPRELAEESLKNLYDGVKTEEIEQAMVFAARSRIEQEPDYSFVAARLLLRKLYHEALPHFSTILLAALKFPGSPRNLGILICFDLRKLFGLTAMNSSPTWAFRPSTTAI